MSKDFLVRRVHINSRNKQMSVSLPKKKIKSLDPTLKFDEDLFVKIKLLRRK